MTTLANATSRPPAHNEPEWDDESAVFSLNPAEPTDSAQRMQGPPSPSPLARGLSEASVADAFSQYHRYVAQIGRRILGSSADVEDLIQDVFLATVKDIHKVREPAKLRGWLATVATRMAYRKRRSSSLGYGFPADPHELMELPSQDASPESRADQSGKWRGVLELPEELRTPWLLKHLHGLTLEGVAARCGCSMSTTQRRLQAAAGRLARKR